MAYEECGKGEGYTEYGDGFIRRSWGRSGWVFGHLEDRSIWYTLNAAQSFDELKQMRREEEWEVAVFATGGLVRCREAMG
jgi:hypothetical protein